MRKILHLFSLLLLMLCSTGTWADTVVLSTPSESLSVWSDAGNIVTLTDKATKGGIQAGSVTIQGVKCMKLSGSREFVLTYSSDVTINSVKLYAISNGDATTTVGTSSNDKDSYGSTEAKTGTVKEFTLTGESGEGLYFSGQSNAVIVVDYTSGLTVTSVEATGIKVNGTLINGKFDANNSYTLDATVLAPKVAVVTTTTYSNKSTKDKDVTVDFSINAEKTLYTGSVVVGETTYTLTAPVKALSTTLADVTGSTTWDWAKTGATEIKFDENSYPAKDQEVILGDLIPNTEAFNSDAIKIAGEYAVRDGKYFQGPKVMFHTTKPGTIKVSFSNTGNRSEGQERWLYVNGKKTEYGSIKSDANDVTTDDIEVAAGDVELTAFLTDETKGSQYLRIYSIVFTEGPEPSNWKDIKLDFTTENSFIRTVTTEQWGVVNTGVALDPTNSPVAVATDSEDSRMTIIGKYHGTQYGLASAPKFVVPVEGPVKISIGSSYYEGSYTLTNAEGTVSKTFSSLVPGKLWSQKDPQVVIAYYDGDATTLTIAGSGNSYCPYFAIEAVDPAEIPNDRTIKFNAGEGTGKAPAAATIENGSEFVVPANTALYKEGYTLTAWTDGTENYATGATIKVVKDMELTAVYTKNEADINNRDEEVTVKWEFATNKGVTQVGFEGNNGSGFLVGQAKVNGKTIDVKLDIDATSGKFNNSNGDWAQVNPGTKFILPSAKDAVISTYAMNDPTAESTANGQSYDSFASNVATWTMLGEETTAEVTIKAGSWYQWIQVVLPKTEAVGPTPAEWESYELVLNAAGLLTADEISTKEQTTFGIALDEEGKAIRVAADATDAIAVITGNYYNDHGMTPFSMTAKVPGAVKVTVGTCTYGITKLKINGTQVADDSKKDGCWKNDTKYVVSGIYNGEAGEITITTDTYTPYIKIEKLASQPQEFSVTYKCDDKDLQGKVPAAFTVIEGNKFTVPANRTMYREGWTLSEWAVFTSPESEEAIAALKPGDEYTPTSDCYLYPIWNKNNYTLADREEAVTVKWDFQQKNGAPIIASEGKDGEIYVTQVNLKVLDGMFTFPVDVKLDFSTKSGKVANGNWSDWCQMNSGTTFTIPSCKGATVSIESYDATTTTTVDGVAAEGNTNKTYSTEIGSKADAIDIVIGDGSYFRYIQVVLPVVETPAGKTKEADLINTDMTDLSAVTSGDANTLVITTTGSKENITFTFHNTTVEPTYKNTDKFGDTTGAMIAQKDGQATITTSAFANITKVTYIHGATGSNRGWGLKVKGDGDSDWVTLSDAVANPSKGTTVTVDVNRTNVQLQWYNLADSQNAMMFDLNIKGNITVYGEEYEVAADANNADAGSATIYPAGGTYTEGDEITLTATENFGYDFVNWTNAAGEEVSKDAKFKTTVSANETYTANFVQVDTYAINVAVEGGANDYMVTFNPAPTVVENKNMYEAGTKVAITAAENPILTFNNWSNGETSKEIEVTMNEDIDLTATYSAVDFIVGWDFYKAGNNGRNADFFAADNDAVSLVLRDEAGKTYGWLDKSQLAAGGYEGRPGAVNWKNDAAIGTYYWQTKVNAEAFTNLKIKTAMVYNYNAYQKYDVQASLNGTDWEAIGSINMTGAKAWTDLEASFPETYNNQKEVYVRWIADKESAIDGTTSQNDGACLGATYITGTAKLVDDGTAPVLVSTVPAEGADNASANGKIVLTFDEKVKVADGAKATLGDNLLTPAVSGKTVSFEYKGLQYSTAYTFTLPANSVSDLTDNAIAEAITINFQTKAKPAVEKGLYDVIVTNGEEMKAAIAQANSRADKTKRFRIFVMPGSHKIPVYDTQVTVNVELKGGSKEERTYAEPRTYITADNISIIGADYETTTITNTTPTETFEGQFGEANISEGIGNNDVFQISAKNTYFQGVTVKTGIGDARGRDIAVQDKGDKTIFKDARLWGYQDTYTNNNSNGRFYFEGGVVRGRTDYLCGKGDIWFEGVTLQQCGQGGYPIVPSQPKKYGWIFNGCTLTPETSDVTCTLGRPWGSGTPIALLINTTMEVVPGAEGWSEMSGGWPKRFAEYNSTTKTGTVIDLSQRKKTFGGKENINNPILTAEEAAEYSIAKVMGDGDDWDPTAYTEQASAPTNVSLKEEALTWDDSNYVFCWAVIKNGVIVEFTTTPTYTVDDKTATWSVRAANEMGGLGEATIADTTLGINEAVSAQSRSAKYVTPTGIVIVKDGKKYTVTGAQMK